MTSKKSKPASAVGFRDRIVGFRRIKAGQIVVDPLNPIRHTKQQRSALIASLKSIGIVDALLVRERDDGKFALIDGELRRGVLKSQPLPCLVLDLNADESTVALATMRAIGDLAEYDAETLAEIIAECADSTLERELFEMLTAVAAAEGVAVDGLDAEGDDAAEPAAAKKKKRGRRVVQLNFEPEEIAAFEKCERELRRKYETTTEAATVLAALREAFAVVMRGRKSPRGKSRC